MSCKKVISDHLYGKCVQRAEKKGVRSQCEAESELFQNLTLQGMLRVLHSMKATDQPEMVQKSKYTFRKTQNVLVEG